MRGEEQHVAIQEISRQEAETVSGGASPLDGLGALVGGLVDTAFKLPLVGQLVNVGLGVVGNVLGLLGGLLGGKR